MVTGAYYLPDDSKKHSPFGEDSYFICDEKCTIGVADGVGGWGRKGVDAGKYARELMINSHLAVQKHTNGVIEPKRILTEAFYNTHDAGSSTACIITLVGDCLHAVNIGDSGFVVIRDGKIVYRSPVQQHNFNCPYQLGNTGKERDRPKYAMVFKVAVEPGDVIVAATDGLFDNLFGHEIEEIVNVAIENCEDTEDMAMLLGENALFNALDEEVQTPFMEAAERAGKKRCNGKMDDITVIVARIVSCCNTYF
ncbi:probable protein phosphatase 2C 55 [Cornus florida]|uniref:probable protein phosphatase 2C 55 n=1 Tax=Cornus florida TaxID=4283 RepID=UPI0028A05BDA|nr:probable protein phosphatase 2C 55 [Cornus florida]XP_059650094.1 probable protein phosphatase 2C 55 [Cornus florida]